MKEEPRKKLQNIIKAGDGVGEDHGFIIVTKDLLGTLKNSTIGLIRHHLE
ncbi:MAG: hypothetical protein HY787_25240 [Deltaproteobacteria bacterium]|nr:hypothetical protein [Deltaproteobacteria bacterium]